MMSSPTSGGNAAPFIFEECMKQCMHSLTTFLSSPPNSSSSLASYFSDPSHIDQSTAASPDRRATLELALKRILLQECARVPHDTSSSSSSTSTSASSPTKSNGDAQYFNSSSSISHLFSAAIHFKVSSWIDPITPLLLIEDLFDASTLRHCEIVFNMILHPRLDEFIRATDPQRARLIFFRLCNSLLRRLSKTTNTFFAGKISMSISYICSVDERSAVNPGGRWNKENITLANDPPAVVESPAAAPESKEEGESDDVKMEDTATDTTAPPKPSFYESLWSLQSHFLDPTALKSPDTLASFTSAAELVLSRFESVSINEKDAIAAIVSAGNKAHVSGETEKHSVFPKYLTGGRLLELQIRDPLFRREVALQMLIFLAHVLNPLGNVEVMREVMTSNNYSAAAVSAPPAAAPANTSATSTAATSVSAQQLAQTSLSGVFLPVTSLPPLRTLFLRTLRFYKLTPPFAYAFSEAFLSLLAREQKFWIGWKEAKCPPLARPPVAKSLLNERIDVEATAKKLRDQRATVAVPAPAANESKESSDAASKKRKLDAMKSTPAATGGMPFSRKFGAPADPTASLRANGRLRMGTLNLAKLWDPEQSYNQDPISFAKDEERAAPPNLQWKYIDIMVDEEKEYRRAEEAKLARKDGDASMDSVDDDADGGMKLSDLLRSDPRKPMQFLRLCLLTPEVTRTWLGEDTEEKTTGIDLFMKSEGSLAKIVDQWITEKKKAEAGPTQTEEPATMESDDSTTTTKVKEEATVDAVTVPVVPADTPASSPSPSDSPQPIETESHPTAVSSPTPESSSNQDEAQERASKRIKIETKESTTNNDTKGDIMDTNQ